MPASVHVLVDRSASMAGYFNGSSELKTTAAGLAAALVHSGIAHQEYAPVDEDGLPDQAAAMSSDAFINAMRGGTQMKGKESLLQKTLGTMVRQDAGTGVWMLITDSIISYSDAEIRKDRRINIDNLPSLGAQVKSAFSPAPSTGKGAVLLASLSSFQGKYSDYDNTQEPCCTGKRPFYAWLVGPSDQVQALTALLPKEGVRFQQEVAFNPVKIHPPVLVLEKLGRVGPVYRSRRRDAQGLPENNVVEAKQFSGKPVQFALAADFSGLPESMQDTEYLRRNLHVSDPEHALRLLSVDARQDVEKNAANAAEASALNGYTHVLFFELGPVATASEHAEFTLGRDPPDWYKSWSNNDDQHTATEKTPTTFGLSYLVEGVAGAFASSKPDGDPVLRVVLPIRR